MVMYFNFFGQKPFELLSGSRQAGKSLLKNSKEIWFIISEFLAPQSPFTYFFSNL